MRMFSKWGSGRTTSQSYTRFENGIKLMQCFRKEPKQWRKKKAADQAAF